MGNRSSKAQSEPQPLTFRPAAESNSRLDPQSGTIHISQRLVDRLTHADQESPAGAILYTQSQVDRLLAEQQQNLTAKKEPDQKVPLSPLTEKYSTTQLMQQIDQLLSEHPAPDAASNEQLKQLESQVSQCFQKNRGQLLNCRSTVEEYQRFVRSLYGTSQKL